MILTLLALGQAPTAPALLKRVAAAYQRLSSYQDSVEVVSIYPGSTWRQAFKTSFERPNRWRLDYSEFKPNGAVSKCVLWSNGKAAQLWTGLDGDTTPAPNIGLGFGSMAMIAGDFVQIVPTLLDPKNVYSSVIGKLTKPTILSDDKVGQAICYRIMGNEDQVSKLTLWVDKKRLLILKVVRDTDSPHYGKGRATATFTPTANPKIAPLTFNFVPPK